MNLRSRFSKIENINLTVYIYRVPVITTTAILINRGLHTVERKLKAIPNRTLDKIDQPYSDCDFICCGLVTLLSEIGLLAAATSSCHQKSYVAWIERPRCFLAPLILLYQRLQGKGTASVAIVPHICCTCFNLCLILIPTVQQHGFEEGLQAKQ